jgi:hypothetical protein
MWLNLVFLLLLALIFVPAVILLLGISRWQAGTTRLRSDLEAARGRIVPNIYDTTELTGLPAPVQDYFRAVLKDGQPIIAAAELRQEGDFDLGRTKGRWTRVVASQSVVMNRPGFDWDARIRVGPAMKVFVHDAYVAGSGVLKAALFGLFPVAKVPSSPELAHAELMRFLAEAPLYPTKLLPSQGIRWDPIDDRSARATLADGDLSVSLVFDFDDAGLISRAHAAGRYRAVDGAMIQTPWEAKLSDYQERSAMKIPIQSEVAWILPEARTPYWRGRVTDILYKFSA